MSENQVYILQNQDKLFLSKQREWVDGRDLQVIFKTKHKDEALNQSFEATSKDYSLRIQLVSCPSKPNGLPEIDPDILPPPLPKIAAEDSPDHDQSESENNEVTTGSAESIAEIADN